MANYKAEIITKWQNVGGNYAPIVPTVIAWQDATGQPVENIKNTLPAYTIQATVTDAQLTAIQNDSAYTVLWSQEIPEDETEPQPIADYTEQELASLKTELERGDLVPHLTSAEISGILALVARVRSKAQVFIP